MTTATMTMTLMFCSCCLFKCDGKDYEYDKDDDDYGSADDSDNAMKTMMMDGTTFLFSLPITQNQKVVNGLSIAN